TDSMNEVRLARRPAQLSPGSKKSAQRVLKRAIDIVVGVGACLIAIPLSAVIAALIKLDSKGPVIFAADRVGEGGRVFRLYKFRSMVPDAHEQLDQLTHLNQGGKYMIKIADDPRVTQVGCFLRKYSLDEIPQLWNVLRGDMSLVGPRPQAPSEVALYDDYQRRRLSVPAGITGWWQVTARDDPRFEVWAEKDLEYIDNWSIRLDLTIIFRTIGVVLKGRDGAPKAVSS
ncbi:MAG TPA: sugar transferase, partial [Terriglobia bacterium]|nr:sugar transferase [Terriglobia bacterium]